MPRVSEAHLASRRRQILDAATRCFARKGFHTTSMQDVIGEAGLSVGAFYRYFRSKDELIRAIADEVVGGVAGALDRLVEVEPLPPVADVLSGVMDLIAPLAEPDGALRMAIQVWGEALRDPGLAAMVAEKYGGIRSRMQRLAERAAAEGQVPPETDPRALGSALFSLMIGYFLQYIMVGGVDRETYLRALRVLLPG